MKINTLYNKDKRFPSKLTGIDTPPSQLYYRGKLPNNTLPVVAVVGTRKPSTYGIATAKKLSSELARSGVTVVSGLALGIDSVAHQACIDAGGVTIAVLPTGLEKTYPASNHQLAERIIAQGGTLISEYRAVDSIRKHDFLIRNRLISGLADVVVVVESAARGGSLNTASHAINQGKTVMAVPGPITSPTSAGTNALIKEGAGVITSTEDILFELGISPETQTQQIALRFARAEHQTIANLLATGPLQLHEIQNETKLKTSELSQVLTEMELEGHIDCTGGRWHTR